jgi:hypothetical protein
MAGNVPRYVTLAGRVPTLRYFFADDLPSQTPKLKLFLEAHSWLLIEAFEVYLIKLLKYKTLFFRLH